MIFCAAAGGIILIGLLLCIYKNYIEAGTILTISGAISELLGNLFIKQYRLSLNKVSEEYYRLLVCHNMNEVLNFAKKLPLTDTRNQELRYLEIRETLRAVMKNFDEHIAGK